MVSLPCNEERWISYHLWTNPDICYTKLLKKIIYSISLTPAHQFESFGLLTVFLCKVHKIIQPKSFLTARHKNNQNINKWRNFKIFFFHYKYVAFHHMQQHKMQETKNKRRYKAKMNDDIWSFVS